MGLIYSIKNKVNNRIYIGKTETNFNSRCSCHKYHLNQKSHQNCKLQKDWNVNGENNFIFEIIEENEYCGKDLIKREKYYVKKYKPYYNIHFNDYNKDGNKDFSGNDYVHIVFNIPKIWKEELEREARFLACEQNRDVSYITLIRSIIKEGIDKRKNT